MTKRPLHLQIDDEDLTKLPEVFSDAIVEIANAIGIHPCDIHRLVVVGLFKIMANGTHQGCARSAYIDMLKETIGVDIGRMQ